jgi:hypothetical protein
LIQAASSLPPRSTGALLGHLATLIPGLRPVDHGGASLEVAFSSPDPPITRSAELLEDPVLRARSVAQDIEPVFGAFLDGVQESRTVAWLGTVPIVLGRLAAVVRTRPDRRLVTWKDGFVTRRALYAPWRSLFPDARAPHDIEFRDVHDAAMPDDAHPFLRLQAASKAVKQDRETLERDLAERFCASGDCPLYIDGNLPPSDVVRGSAFVTGVIKSHHTLYVEGRHLDTVLALRSGERSSVFVVDTRRRPAVASWYLRVRDAERQSPFWGLVRVEAPLDVMERALTSEADARSAWILAERSPVALPDGRWDTMAYGIRNCEEYLRAAMAVG